jgi:hypothetical protein
LLLAFGNHGGCKPDGARTEALIELVEILQKLGAGFPSV